MSNKAPKGAYYVILGLFKLFLSKNEIKRHKRP